jgi:kinesin family protein 4/21/27
VTLASGHAFTFDHVYAADASAPAASPLFDACVRPLVCGLLSGFNATVLAYGQTGSGKTHTMGTSGAGAGGAGIIPRAVALLFAELDSAKHSESPPDDIQLNVSFIEIFKEDVRDLLADAGAPPLALRELPGGGAAPADARSPACVCAADVAAALSRGGAARATAATGMNATSSRSHAVLTLHLTLRRGDASTHAKLHLVDLAGSERIKRTKAEGVRLQEGIHINRGLLALGNVIAALGDDSRRRPGGHIPYRDSKLTRLLADALGGNSRTCMIACVSPADSSLEESLNTLKYANR